MAWPSSCYDRVIDRLHDAGLTIAGILGLVAVDGYVVEQLRGVIYELDAAARDLRTRTTSPRMANTTNDPSPRTT